MWRKTKLSVALATILVASSVSASEDYTGTVNRIVDGKVIQTIHTYFVGQTPPISYVSSGRVPEELSVAFDAGLEQVALNKDYFLAQIPSEKTTLSIFGEDVSLIADAPITYPNGDVSYNGHTEDGQTFSITFNKEGEAEGFLMRGDSQVTITSVYGSTWMIDSAKAGSELIPIDEGALAPTAAMKMTKAYAAGAVTGVKTSTAPVTSTALVMRNVENTKPYTATVVDVYVAISGSFFKYSQTAIYTKINNYITISNKAYSDSGLPLLSIRLVGTKNLGTVIDGSSNDLVLKQMSYPNSYPTAEAVVKTITTERDKAKADLAIYLRPFLPLQQGMNCGVAWLGGVNQSALNSSVGFAVVGDGTYFPYSCNTYTFTHEIGHMMGLSHDKAHSANIPGYFPFSFGYIIPESNGGVGDIMSYASGIIGKFSSPNLIYKGAKNFPLGVTDVYDGVRTLNTTTRIISTYR